MQALIIRQFGDPKLLKVEEVPTPQPGPDEVLVAVRAASINPSDIKNVAGAMHGTTLPRIPGRDFAGVITQGPPDLLGQEVWGTGGDLGFTRDGTHAQFLLLPRAAVAPKPAALSMESAGAAGVTFTTAWSAIVTLAAVRETDTCVVIGAAGGVGSAAVQIASARGARVVGIVRSDADIETVTRLGAAHVINAKSANPVQAVQDFTAHQGANVIFDTSGMMLADSLDMAALDARIPIITAPKDGLATFNLRTLYRKAVRLLGLDTLRLSVTDCATLLRQIAPYFQSAQFSLQPPTPRPLAEAPAAYLTASQGGARIVLRP